MRSRGAKKVHVRSASPPIAYPCFYGVDFPSHEELVYGSKHNKGVPHEEAVEMVREELGVDTLAYLSIEGLIKAINLPKEDLCLACLNGNYWFSHEETEKFLNNGRI